MPETLPTQAKVFFGRTWDIIQSVIPVFDADSYFRIKDDFSVAVAAFDIPLAYKKQPEGAHSDLYRIYIKCEMCGSREGSCLTVLRSQFAIRVGSVPGVRFEYEREKNDHPAAHIHYHGVAGLLSPALMKNVPVKKARDGKLENLHFPVGGHRFRPSLEDFLYFVIRECGFQGKPGWEEVLLDSREQWMERQLGAAIFDQPEVACRKLEKLGYVVIPPENGHPAKRLRRNW